MPGGKIEASESPQTALEREIAEALGLRLIANTVRYLYTVEGPAYAQSGRVKLICFDAEWDGEPAAYGEVSDVDWISRTSTSRFAPAVDILCRDFLAFHDR